MFRGILGQSPRPRLHDRHLIPSLHQERRVDIHKRKLMNMSIFRPRLPIGILDVIAQQERSNNHLHHVGSHETPRTSPFAITKMQVNLVRGSVLVFVFLAGVPAALVVVAKPVERLGVLEHRRIAGDGVRRDAELRAVRDVGAVLESDAGRRFDDAKKSH